MVARRAPGGAPGLPCLPCLPCFPCVPRLSRSLRLFGLIGVLAVVSLAAFCGCSSDDGDNGGTSPTIQQPEDFLPPGDASWARASLTQTASTVAELQAAINGAFTIYEQHGFEEFAGTTYDGTLGAAEVTLRAWIFEMGANAQALSLHDEDHEEIRKFPPSSVQVINDLGDTARFWEVQGIPYPTKGLDFVRNEYWVRLEVPAPSINDAEAVLEAFARSIDQDMTD